MAHLLLLLMFAVVAAAFLFNNHLVRSAGDNVRSGRGCRVILLLLLLSGGSSGELYLSKLEKRLLGLGSRVGAHSPLEDLT